MNTFALNKIAEEFSKRGVRIVGSYTRLLRNRNYVELNPHIADLFNCSDVDQVIAEVKIATGLEFEYEEKGNILYAEVPRP